MPELPDVEVYREALAPRVVGRPLVTVQLRNPFVLRTVVPPLDAVIGRIVRDVQRLGKRIVLWTGESGFKNHRLRAIAHAYEGTRVFAELVSHAEEFQCFLDRGTGEGKGIGTSVSQSSVQHDGVPRSETLKDARALPRRPAVEFQTCAFRRSRE